MSVRMTDNPYDYIPEENKCPTCGGSTESSEDGAMLYCPTEKKYWRFA